MRKALFIIWQCTWGFMQTTAGAIIFLCLIGRKHYMYHGAVVTYWRVEASLSLGLFVFITEGRREPRRQKILVHEYGHCIQSLILGPLYLPFVALPSMLWCQLKVFERMRDRKNMSYYDMPIEKSASDLGEKVTKEVAER